MALQPEDIHPQIISDLKSVLGAIVAIVVSLVGALYLRLKNTDTRLLEAQAEGQGKTQNNSIDIEKLKKDVESIREWVVDLEQDVDITEARQLADHETLHAVQKVIESIKIHHKHQHGEDL